MKRHLIGVAAAVLGTMLIGGVVVQTATAAPAPSVVTLPLFGAQLNLEIVNGPGGALTSVAVTSVPPTLAAGTVATKLDPHKVVFESANLIDPLGDPAKVVIKSRKGTQKISARAGSLADVSGPGSWVGDVFGSGNVSTVPFTIADVGGSPSITLGGILVGADVATAVPGPLKVSSGDDDDEMEQSARISVKFTNTAGDQSRTLSIKVKVEEDDGKTEAKLSIALSKIKGVPGTAVGTHTWIGVLCNNADASITYTVGPDGLVAFGTITPTATTSTDDGKATVTFDTGERVRIKVKGHDDELRLSVKERIRCDSADPTTNVSTSIPDDDHDGDHHDDGDHKGGGDDHGRGGGHDDD